MPIALAVFSITLLFLLLILGIRIFQIRKNPEMAVEADGNVKLLTEMVEDVGKSLAHKSKGVGKTILLNILKSWLHISRQIEKGVKKIVLKIESILEGNGDQAHGEKSTFVQQITSYKRKMHTLRREIKEAEDKKMPKF